MKLKLTLFILTLASVLLLSSCLTSRKHFVEISCNQFIKNSQYSSEISMDVGDLVTVTLCSNPTTGFGWSEEISDETVIKQVEHEFLPPEGKDDKPTAPGAAEEEIWVYEAIKEGASTISFEYSQPWQGGEKEEWTYDLTLVVESDSE